MKKIMMSLLLVAAAAGCGTSRDADAYRADTQKLLDSHSADLKRCYDDALKADRSLAGTVTVQFVVEKEIGDIGRATIDQSKTTAPPALGQCVLHALEGLRLDPPDNNEGHATFVYEFKPAAPPS